MKGNRIAKVTEQSKAGDSDPGVHSPGPFPLRHAACALHADWGRFQFSLLGLPVMYKAPCDWCVNAF